MRSLNNISDKLQTGSMLQYNISQLRNKFEMICLFLLCHKLFMLLAAPISFAGGILKLFSII